MKGYNYSYPLGDVIRRSGGGAAPVPADYIVTSDAEWTTVFANSDATLSGKIVEVQGTAVTAQTLATRTFSPALTIRGASGNEISGILTLSAVSGLTLNGLNFQFPSWPKAASNSGIISWAGACASIRILNCSFRHGYGASQLEFDTDFQYDEYTRVNHEETATTTSARYPINWEDPTMTRGEAFVFNNGANPVYVKVGGSTVTATTSDSLVQVGSAYLNVNGLNPTTDTHFAVITTGGNSAVNFRAEIGMTQYLAAAFVAAGGSTVTDLEIRNCAFEDLFNALKGLPNPYGHLKIWDNTIRRCYGDLIALGVTGGASAGRISIVRNQAERPFCRSGIAQTLDGDAGDPHGDYMQTFGDAQPIQPILVADCRVIPSALRAGAGGQGIFISDQDADYRDISIVGGLFLGATRQVSIGEVADTGDCLVYGVTAIDPSEAGIGQIIIYQDPDEDFSLVAASVADSIDNRFGIVREDTGVVPATITDMFPNFADWITATTPDELEAAFSTEGTVYEGMGFSDLRSTIINTTTNDIDEVVIWSAIPPFWRFPFADGITASSTYTSGYTKIIAGGDGMTVTPGSGVTFDIADDAIGTNATGFVSSGTIDRGQYIRYRVTASGTAGAITTSSLTIGGVTRSATIQTADTAFASTVWDGTTYHNRAGAPAAGGETGVKHMLFAARLTSATFTSLDVIISGGTNKFSVFCRTSNIIEVNFGGSTNIAFRIPNALTTTGAPQLLLISVDSNAATVNEGVKCWLGGTKLTSFTNTTWTEDFTLNLSTLGAATLMARTASLDRIMNLADLEFIWLAFGTRALISGSLPDIDDPEVRAEWSFSNIGANGEGPTGQSPQYYFAGNAAAFNAGGGINLGVAGALTKVAGSVTDL